MATKATSKPVVSHRKSVPPQPGLGDMPAPDLENVKRRITRTTRIMAWVWLGAIGAVTAFFTVPLAVQWFHICWHWWFN